MPNLPTSFPLRLSVFAEPATMLNAYGWHNTFPNLPNHFRKAPWLRHNAPAFPKARPAKRVPKSMRDLFKWLPFFEQSDHF